MEVRRIFYAYPRSCPTWKSCGWFHRFVFVISNVMTSVMRCGGYGLRRLHKPAHGSTPSVVPDTLSQVTKPVREVVLDSLLAHCIARAVIHDQVGIDAAVEKYGPKAERLSKWAALRTAAKVTPKASRVASSIVQWAVAMRDEGMDEYSITQYQRYWYEGERQTYRLQKDFRELWFEFETPNELASQIVKNLDAKLSRREIAALPSTVRVRAEQPA